MPIPPITRIKRNRERVSIPMSLIHVDVTTKASPDGIEIRNYIAGEVYEMPTHLADVFVREGWGREAELGVEVDTGTEDTTEDVEENPGTEDTTEDTTTEDVEENPGDSTEEKPPITEDDNNDAVRDDAATTTEESPSEAGDSTDDGTSESGAPKTSSSTRRRR